MEAEGYNRLAILLGAHSPLFLCRKFMTLHAYVILSLQAELVDLEADLAQIAHWDRTSDEDREHKISFHSSFIKLKAAVSDPVRVYQWSKIGEIKAKLNEYDAARACFRELASSPPVKKRDLDHLRSWLSYETGGSHSITGIEAVHWWEEKYTHDLASLLPEDENKDAFSKWVEDTVVHIFHKLVGHRMKRPIVLAEAPDLPQPLYHYSAARIANAIDVLVTILSSLLPTIPFFTLYYIHSPLGKMGAIMGFTFLFSVVLKLVAKVKRIDCFTAGTAFAAVQVVFLSIGPQTPSS